MLFQFILSVVASLVVSIWTYTFGQNYWYLYPFGDNKDDPLAYQIAVNTGIWFVALMNFVPVSLLVTLEMINFIQAYFIE